jgi:arylsulfatase A-like enzyme
MKVQGIVNEIRGFTHDGKHKVGVPAVFGMNFQAVSVGQKLKAEQVLTAPLLTGGYASIAGALVPSDGLEATLDHTDLSIGAMVMALADQGLLDSTLIIVTAKHGNSPMDPSTLVRVNPTVISTIVNTVAPGLALLSADTGPLIWLKDSSTAAAVVEQLNLPANRAAARIDHILWGAELAALYADPLTDARVPDIIILPAPGTVYTTSLTKIADHGGFGDEDVHVALVVANSLLPSKAIGDPVETRQIACTVLKALTLACDGLMSEQIEPSKFLPHSDHKNSASAIAISKSKKTPSQ